MRGKLGARNSDIHGLFITLKGRDRMEVRYFKHWSFYLNRDMEFKVYGIGNGKAVLGFPCQGGRFYDFENFGMIDHWKPLIEADICTFYACDSIDNEAWSAKDTDPRQRIENHEKWYHYICLELVPYIHQLQGNGNGIMTFGCSMGAMHAANLYYRQPSLFDRMLALSGLYDSQEFFGDYCDNLVYLNCPCYYLPNLSPEHPYMEMYRKQKSLIVCGQGAYEDLLLKSTHWLDTVCRQKGIPTRFEYWGHDVSHDWYWWFKMVELYAPELLR